MFPLTLSPRARRLTALVQLTVFLPACSSWIVEPVTPSDLVQTQHPRSVRITQIDHSHLTLDKPEIRSDTLYGSTSSANGELREPTGIALGDIDEIAVRKTDVVETSLLVLGGAAAAAGVGVLIFLASLPAD